MLGIRDVMQWSQSPYPHLEDGTTYHLRRPTPGCGGARYCLAI